MDVNERIQNMLSARIDALEAVIKMCARQSVTLWSNLNVMECRRLDETEYRKVSEDAHNQIREIVAVLEATTEEE